MVTKTKPLIINAFLLLALGLCGAGCDDLLGGSDGGGTRLDGTVPQPDQGPPPSGIVTLKKAGETATADFTAGSTFLVVPYSVSASSGDIDFEIKLSGATGTTTHRLTRRAKLPPLRQRNPALWQRWENRLKVERWTRQQAERAAASPLNPPAPAFAATCATSAECQSGEVCSGGNCAGEVTVKVSEFSSSQTITAAVKAKGKTAAILVDKNDTVDSATITKLLDAFEKVIYPRDVAVFGNPPLKSGGSQLSTDRNGDGLVWLVLTKKVSDKLPAVGFFNATDFTDKAASNKADILYIDTKSTAKLADVYPIMAHEFQHLLNFAVKKYKPEAAGGTGALEALWLDEGLSHFAEDICGYGGENVTLLDQEVFTSFEETSVFSTTDSKAMRGMAMLFVRYLFEQQGGVSYLSSGAISDKGGASFIQKLRQTTKQGTGAVDSALGSSYKSAFDNWVAAVALDGRGVTNYSKWVYAPLKTDPVTGNQLGIKIRGTLKDNTGGTTTLKGPLEESLDMSGTDDTIPGGSAKYFIINSGSGKVSVTVTTSESDFRFALIKLK